MAESKQRQDVVFLALAVAVLAIAVALFVVMRSIPKGRKTPPPEDTQQQIAEEPKKPAEPAAGRDPFSSQRPGQVSGPAPAAPQTDLTLKGVTLEHGGQARAIIRSPKRHYNVGVGDTVRGYTVVSIGENQVVLQGGGGETILLLREPEAEEE